MADLGTGYNPGNLDLATQQAELERRRNLAQALLLRSMQEQPTQMAGQVAIRNGPLSAIGKVLTSYFANKSMTDANDEEKRLVNETQDKQSAALQDLMNSTRAQPGTPTKITEQAGPPDAQGVPSMSVEQGTPGGLDQSAFANAMAKATRAGVNPAVIGSMLTRFNRNDFLAGDPSTASMVPGMQGGAPSVTPGNANQGAQLSLPAGVPAAAGGSAFGAVPPKAARLMLSGDTELAGLGKTMAEMSKPISGRAGAPLWGTDANGNPVMVGFSPSLEKGQTVDAQGNVTTSPGYVKSMKEIKGTEADIGASHQMAMLKMPDGSEVQVPLDQALSLTGRTATAAPQTATAAPGAVPPGTTFNFQNAPASEVQAALRDASSGGATPMPAGSPGMRVGTSQSTAQKAFQETSGGDLAKQFQGYRDASDAATANDATVSQMKDALSQFDPNAGSPARQKIAEVLQAAGASDDTVKKVAGGQLDAIQEFNKLAFGNSVSNLRTLVGPGQRISQLEMLTNYKNSPNQAIQRAAGLTMLDMQAGGNQWVRDRNETATAWAKAGKDPAEFNSWFNRNRPLTGTRIDPATGQDTGEPYIPTIAEVRARIAAAEKAKATQGLGTQQVSGGIGSSPAGWSIQRLN